MDYKITTRELIKIFQDSGIDLKNIRRGRNRPSHGRIYRWWNYFCRTGGVIESALRTALENMTGEKIENVEFHSLRGFDGFRACGDVEVGDIKTENWRGSWSRRSW